MLQNQSDLTTVCRATGGQIPTKRKGASLTVLGDKLYVFGGLLPDNTTAVSELFVLDLVTLQWTEVRRQRGVYGPPPRYFHSADIWNEYIVIFGGRTVHPQTSEAYDLSDVHLFNTSTQSWEPSPAPPHPGDDTSNTITPTSRYAHLSSISGDQLFIFGGQDIHDAWLDDILVFNLPSREWVARHHYQGRCGRYRSVAVSSELSVQSPEVVDDADSDIVGSSGSASGGGSTGRHRFIRLPFTKAHCVEDPAPIWLYTNQTSSDKQVRRGLETLVPILSEEGDFTLDDHTRQMSGSLPPGLRFPTAHLIGSHLLLSGVMAISNTQYTLAIYNLDLLTLQWSKLPLDTSLLHTGAWLNTCLWSKEGDAKLLVLGDRRSSMADDYRERAASFDHIVLADLEPFGIYQPPSLKLDVHMQELGLAALKGQHFTDFELICDDGMSIACSRKLLEDRWPWLRIRLQALKNGTTTSSSKTHDARLTPHSFRLCEPYPTTLALLQYIYSLSLLTSLQHAPAIRNQLLVVATSYDIPYLAELLKHAMHRELDQALEFGGRDSEVVKGICQVATICGCRGIQMRALKAVMDTPHPRPSYDDETRTSLSSGAREDRTLIEELGREWVNTPSRPRDEDIIHQELRYETTARPPPHLADPSEFSHAPSNSHTAITSSSSSNSSNGVPTKRIQRWLSSAALAPHPSLPNTTPSFTPVANTPTFDKKLAKAEEKRRKKAEESRRFAHLTEQLAAKDAARKATASAAKVKGRPREPGVMFGGFVL